ncbi:MAG: hypothetical protein BRC25_00665 [Parcubacteria group bacterium SW_6_46_9]|nr:MAG: hypothetical protein BRC25_00665 [Parcubacteria group bacterium SW_6_46_9]
MSSTTPQSPEVTNLLWGSVQTTEGEFKDAKLWPGGARGWDWKETGTSHQPGIQLADIQELLDNGAEIVVLSTGQNQQLQVKDGVVDHLKQRGIGVYVQETNQAVETYNKFARSGKPVGALIHSTC